MVHNKKDKLEQLILSRLSSKEVQTYAKTRARPYQELMAYYKCAIMEVTTKFNVLNEELSLEYDRNPIETVKSRLKSPESIMEKMERKNLPFTVEAIEQNINDIAGVRVICSFPSDLYELAEAFLRQDDITLIQKKDYIKNPKKNGYKSLHLIVKVPIYSAEGEQKELVEIQLRTIAMDYWSVLEYELYYKKRDNAEIEAELKKYAEEIANLDYRMLKLRNKIEKIGYKEMN